MSRGAMVRRCAARDVSSWPVVAAARHDGSQVAVLQYAVRTGAAGRRSVAVHAGPWQAAAAGEPRGTPVRRIAPWPEAPLGGPSPEAVPLDGP